MPEASTSLRAVARQYGGNTGTAVRDLPAARSAATIAPAAPNPAELQKKGPRQGAGPLLMRKTSGRQVPSVCIVSPARFG